MIRLLAFLALLDCYACVGRWRRDSQAARPPKLWQRPPVPHFLTRLVMANVTGMNCPGYALSDGEWTLITGTADKVAAALKLDTGDL